MGDLLLGKGIYRAGKGKGKEIKRAGEGKGKCKEIKRAGEGVLEAGYGNSNSKMDF